MSETQTAIEELIEKIDGDATQRQRERKNQDRENAEDMRRQAIERKGQTQKRKSVEGENETKKKKRSNGSDTLLYLRERNEFLQKRSIKRSLLFKNRNLCCKRKSRKIL